MDKIMAKPTTKKPPALDIFKTLSAMDSRNYDYFSNLTDQEKKGFAPIVAMRWLSAVKGSNLENEFYLNMTNELVNKHLWDSSLTKHPELVYKLMAACGIGSNKRHEWIKGFSKQKHSKFVEFLKIYYPSASKDELNYLIEINSKEQLMSLVNDSGLQDDEIKILAKEVKDLKSNG